MHDGHPIGVRERSGQQHIGFRGLAVGLEVVAAVEHDRVEVGGGDELEDRDLVAAFLGQRGDVLVGDHHGLAAVAFIGLGDVAVLDHLAALGAHALVLDAAVVFRVHLVELQIVVLGGAIHLDRNVDETEGDGTLPDRTHVISMPRNCR